MEKNLKKKFLEILSEQYFRHFQETDMQRLTEKSSVKEIEVYSEIARHDKFGETFLTIAGDLIELLEPSGKKFRSFTAHDYYAKIHKVSQAVKDVLPDTKIFEQIVQVLQHSKNSYIVGGFIRDAIHNCESKDIDFATDIPYKVLKNIFKTLGFTVKEEGAEFLVMIVSKGGENYEIANFRTDSKESDGRHPVSVKVGTMQEDAERRDFTINALFYNLSTKRVEDPTGFGIDDALDKILRFVGKPEERIREDYLRIWRAYRFAFSKGLIIEKRTKKAMRTLFSEAYENSNPARVLQEMIKLEES